MTMWRRIKQWWRLTDWVNVTGGMAIGVLALVVAGALGFAVYNALTAPPSCQ
jgi:hypothetical protein